MSATIGRILLIPKGDYSSSAVYNALDWVRYNGKAWVCKVDNTVNITPAQGDNWQLLAQDGSGGGGGASDWDDINYKPFDTIDTTNDFEVDTVNNNKLKIKRDTYGVMRIVSGGTTTNLEASGDSTFEIDAGTNVTITADDTANPKKITINSSGGGGASTLAGLSDVTLSSLSNGQILEYDNTTDPLNPVWKNVNKPTIPSVSVDHTGTASTTAVRKERITINSVDYDIDGSVYMEDSDSGTKTTFNFTNAAITSTSVIDVYTDTWGDNPSSVTVDGSTNKCTVTFSAAATRTVRIYIK